MGAEATQWQMFQQISLYNKKLGQNCRKGCFLKKHTDFKEMSCGICNIYRAVPAEGRGLQARGRVMRWWELAAGTGTTSGLQQAGQDILKELLWCLKLWFHRAKAGGETGCIQELMCFGSQSLLLSHCGGPHSAAELNGHSWTFFLYPQGCLCGLGPKSE